MIETFDYGGDYLVSGVREPNYHMVILPTSDRVSLVEARENKTTGFST